MKNTTSTVSALLLALAPTLHGQSFNAATGDWMNPLNWNPVGVPGASDIVSLGSAGGQAATLSGDTTAVRMLTISPAAGQTGILNIANGANLTTKQGNGGGIIVGGGGTGTLNLSSGSRLDSLISVIGDYPDGIGFAHLTGIDTLWTPLSLYIGNGGQGTLTIGGGARVETAGIIMASSTEAHTTGALHLNGTPGARGVLQLTHGILNDGNQTGTAIVHFDGGILRSSVNGQLFPHFANGNVKIGGGGAFIENSGGAVIDVTMEGVGGLHKSSTGTLQITGVQTYQGETRTSNGRLLIDGNLQGGGDVYAGSGSTLAGNGVINGNVTVESGGRIAAGGAIDSYAPGNLNVQGGDLEFQGGGGYFWAINDAEGNKGSSVGWGHIQVGGALDITADALDPFGIYLRSLNAANEPGALPFWDPSVNQEWIILTALGGIAGFDPEHFFIESAAFGTHNGLAGGSFHLDVVEIPGDGATLGESRLVLYYTIPEPSALLLMFPAGLAFAGFRRRPAGCE